MLGDIVDFSNEIWNQKDTFIEKFPYIEISAIDVSTGDIIEVNYIPIDEAPSRARKIVKKDDIILSTTRPQRGAISLIDKSKEGFIASTGFAIIRHIKISEINLRYLFYILRTEYSLQQMLQRTSGGNYPAISEDELKKIKIPLPPLSVQNEIVSIMDSAYSSKRAKEAEARALLDSIDGYVMEKLGIVMPKVENKMCFTVWSDELDGRRIDAEYYQPEYENMINAIKKSRYNLYELESLIDKITSGQRPKGGVRNIKKGIPSIGGEHIKDDGSIAINNLKYISENFHNLHLDSVLSIYDVLMIKDGATTGKVGILQENHPYKELNINEHVFLLRFGNLLNPFYLFFVLKSPIGQTQINRFITGATVTGIIKGFVEKLLIPLPLLSVQNEIAAEAQSRMEKAKRLRSEASGELETAKQKVEKMILGE
jgi:restriction endonuclease S subunit